MFAPIFWVALMLMFIFSVKPRLLPFGGRGGIEHSILPTITLVALLSAGVIRITRSSMLNVLGDDYVTIARAKGVSEFFIVWKHAFKNAAAPIVTYIMFLMIFMLSGEIVVENIFGWPGVGRMILKAVLMRDFPLVQAVTVIVSLSFIMINLVADILYAYVNPKVRY